MKELLFVIAYALMGILIAIVYDKLKIEDLPSAGVGMLWPMFLGLYLIGIVGYGLYILILKIINFFLVVFKKT